MPNPDAIDAVREYLKKHLPNCEMVDQHDMDRHAWSFWVSSGNQRRLLTVPDEFLEDHSAGHIASVLNRDAVAEFLRSSEQKRVIYGDGGLKLEDLPS